ncbi:MAG: hypothetical protein ACJ74Z_12620 [Bryobacteraceae bacterium]
MGENVLVCFVTQSLEGLQTRASLTNAVRCSPIQMPLKYRQNKSRLDRCLLQKGNGTIAGFAALLPRADVVLN